jgi:hypothetical protein
MSLVAERAAALLRFVKLGTGGDKHKTSDPRNPRGSGTRKVKGWRTRHSNGLCGLGAGVKVPRFECFRVLE